MPCRCHQVTGHQVAASARRRADVRYRRRARPRAANRGNRRFRVAIVFGIVVEVDPVDVRPRRHDRGRPDCPRARARRGAFPSRLRSIDAGFGAFGDRELDLFLGDVLCALVADAQEIEQQRGRAFRRTRPAAARSATRILQAAARPATAMASGSDSAMRFGTSSPTITRQRGDADDHDGEGDLVSACGADERDRVEDAAEPRAKRRAAERAGQNADQRDADLHGGQEPAWIFRERQARALRRASLPRPSAAGAGAARTTTDISASAKKPLSRMSPTTMASSSQTRHDRDCSRTAAQRAIANCCMPAKCPQEPLTGCAAARANSRRNKGGTPISGNMTGRRPC